jgi:hypothetical protein
MSERYVDYMEDRAEVLRSMAPRRPRSAARVIAALFGALMLLLTLISFANPHVNVPLISPVVCSLKGDTWYDGGLLGPPGCYRPSG